MQVVSLGLLWGTSKTGLAPIGFHSLSRFRSIRSVPVPFFWRFPLDGCSGARVPVFCHLAAAALVSMQLPEDSNSSACHADTGCGTRRFRR